MIQDDTNIRLRKIFEAIGKTLCCIFTYGYGKIDFSFQFSEEKKWFLLPTSMRTKNATKREKAGEYKMESDD